MKNLFKNYKQAAILLGIMLLAIICNYAFDVPTNAQYAEVFLPSLGLKRNREIIKRINNQFNNRRNAAGQLLPPAITMQDSYLRFDQQLKNNSTTYRFDFRQTVNNTNVPSVPYNALLAQGDAFFATFIQVKVGIIDVTAGQTSYPALFNGFITYDNQNIFSAANLTGLTVGDLETLYNTGQITFHMGNTDFLDQAIPVEKCKVVPRTAGNGTTTQDSLNHQVDGCVDLPSIACMSGKLENWWLINTQNKASIAWQATSGNNATAVSMRMYGVLVKGGSDNELYPQLVETVSQVD